MGSRYWHALNIGWAKVMLRKSEDKLLRASMTLPLPKWLTVLQISCDLSKRVRFAFDEEIS